MIPELPVDTISNVSRGLVAMATAVTSPFTATQQVQDWGGEYWNFQVEMARYKGDESRLLDAFFNSLGGVRGRFLFRDPSIKQTIAGTPLVAGAGQTGNTLVTDGWPLSTTVIRAGEFFSIGANENARLYQLSAVAVSNGSGVATLLIHPKLRAAPADNAALEVAAPAIALRLTGPVPASISPADFYMFSFSAREAI